MKSGVFAIFSLAGIGVLAFSASIRHESSLNYHARAPIIAMAAGDPILELKPPAAMYNGASMIGGAKGSLTPLKILLLGILSGCHIGFGAFLSLAVGGACPAIAAANPGLKQIITGAFGLPFGLMMTVIGGGEVTKLTLNYSNSTNIII